MKRRAAWILLLLFFFVAAHPARAQQEPAIASLDVDIWPEYDRPSVLVIYHITVAPDQLPANLRVRIPTEAGAPHAVATVEAAGMFNVPNVEMIPTGDWLELSFQATVPDVRVEYYDPTIVKDGSQREFVFRWGGGTAVQNLSLTVQQPPTAEDLALEPSFTASETGADGLTYYRYEVGPVGEDTPPFAVTMRYSKPDDALTSEFQQAQPSAPIDTSATGRVRLEQVLPWLLGGLGLLLIGTGLFWYTRSTRAAEPAPNRRRHSTGAKETTEPPISGATSAFCHQCGNKASPGDVFCRVCGTKLR